jgi:hypothetical protein
MANLAGESSGGLSSPSTKSAQHASNDEVKRSCSIGIYVAGA